ncbi:MAG: protein-L-isoaspartate(D-aspartate) O-methyltransferase [Gammaproteobacteria bacterium]
MIDSKRMLKDIAAEVELTQRLTGKSSLDKRVIDALGKVPRHQFVPAELRYCAYDNGPVPIGMDQTISQPFIVALMSDLLQTRPGDSVLEVGTGSGYQAAVLACLVEKVYSIEIIDVLAERARERLQRLRYRNVEVRAGDGYTGWPEHAPYDGIIVTAAAPHIPRALLEQLRPGGCLVVPLGKPFYYQELTVVEKKPDGTLIPRNILGVSFVPLTGQCERQPAASNP